MRFVDVCGKIIFKNLVVWVVVKFKKWEWDGKTEIDSRRE